MTREEFKSDEEYHFSLWLTEALKYGLIEAWAYEPETFVISDQKFFNETVQMKTKKKYVPCKVFSNADDLTYTPDFKFILTTKGVMLFSHVLRVPIHCQLGHFDIIYVDVKGKYNFYGGDHRAFFLKQRMMYERHNIFVPKIEPNSFFRKTFAPESMRWMKNRKVPTLTQLGTKAPSSREFVKENEWKLQADMFN